MIGDFDLGRVLGTERIARIDQDIKREQRDTVPFLRASEDDLEVRYWVEERPVSDLLDLGWTAEQIELARERFTELETLL